MKKGGISMVEQLRTAVRESGLTRAELARRADLPYAAVFEFYAGQRDLNFSSAAKLCAVVGLELRKKRKSKGK